MTAPALSAGSARPNGLSVQEALETAIERFCGETVTVHGAGRTDAGVHALAQVAHLDLPREAAPDAIRSALNHHLRPHAISVLAAEPVADDFDARLLGDAAGVYLYRILNRRAPPALERGRVWHVAPPLDVDGDAGGRAASDRAPRFLDLPRLAVPGEIAGQDARRARGDARTATRSTSRRGRARSCTTRCATWPAR